MELTANYTKDFGNHSLTALVGYSYQQFNQESVYAGNEDFSTDGFLYNNLQAGAGTKPYVNSSARKSAFRLILCQSKLFLFRKVSADSYRSCRW